MASERKDVSVIARVPAALAARAREIAEADDRSLSWVVREALSAYVTAMDIVREVDDERPRLLFSKTPFHDEIEDEQA